jgi:hypothetical protein
MVNLLFGHALVIYEEHNYIDGQFNMPDYIYLENYISRHGYIPVLINLVLNTINLSCALFYSEVTESMEQLFYIHEYDTYKKKLNVILKAITMFVIYYYIQSMFIWFIWTDKIENQILTFEST